MRSRQICMTQPDGEQAGMTPRDYFLYAVMVFGWSTSWIMLKQQLGVVAPEVSLFWRYLAAALLMFGLSAVLRQRLRFAAHDHLRFLHLAFVCSQPISCCSTTLAVTVLPACLPWCSLPPR